MLQCEICGKEIHKSPFHGCVICGTTCFTVKFWRDIIFNKSKYAVINGECFCDGGDRPDITDTWELGHSGRRFNIRYFDGREITTNNLWYQGTIPDEYRDELKDNAEFVNPKFSKEGGINY